MQTSNKLYLSIIIGTAFILDACTAVESESETVRKVAESTGMVTNYDQAYQNYLTLGAQYYQSGQYELAEARLKRAIEIDAQKPEAWHGLANVYEAQQNIAAGEQVYEKLITAHPNYQVGFFDYAKFLCKFDRKNEIQKLYTRMRSKGSEFSTLAAISEGDCERQKGDTAGARKAYLQALSLESTAAGALVPMAEIALEQGDYQTAMNNIRTMHSYVSYTPETLRIGILAARGLGDSATEANFVRMMRATHKNSPQAKELGL